MTEKTQIHDTFIDVQIYFNLSMNCVIVYVHGLYTAKRQFRSKVTMLPELSVGQQVIWVTKFGCVILVMVMGQDL